MIVVVVIEVVVVVVMLLLLSLLLNMLGLIPDAGIDIFLIPVTAPQQQWLWSVFICLGVAVKVFLLLEVKTGPDGTVAISLVNGLEGTGFTSRYRL